MTAQNIVKHAYKDYPDTQDRMAVRISCTDKELEISFLTKENQLKKVKLNIDQSMTSNWRSWNFFIQEIMDSIKFKEGDKPGSII